MPRENNDSKKLKKLVTIGGGTGSFTVLSGLREYPELDITAIVSIADDGGSAGRLRDEYGVLPPGDIRQCLVALSEASQELRTLFNYRFSGGSMHGQSLGNIIITGAEKAAGSVLGGIELMYKVLNVRGRVIPACLRPAKLIAMLGDGTTLRGEHEIDVATNLSPAGVASLFFEHQIATNPAAKQALREADLIIVCPGTPHSSIIPNFLPTGMRAAFRQSKAKKIFVCNLMNKFGQTDGFTLADHVREVEKYAGKNAFDYAIFNNKQPSPQLLKRYKDEGVPVILGEKISCEVIQADIVADTFEKRKKSSDVLRRSLIRHDPKKLAKIIISLT